jgi:hypothetical protein
VEIVQQGTAILADADPNRIAGAFDKLFGNNDLLYPPIFGDGKAAEFILQEILKYR